MLTYSLVGVQTAYALVLVWSLWKHNGRLEGDLYRADILIGAILTLAMFIATGHGGAE